MALPNEETVSLKGTSKGWLVALALALITGAGGLLFQMQRPGTPWPNMAAQILGRAEVPPVLESFRDAAKHATPAVVSILSSKTVRLSPRNSDPFWGDLFGNDFDPPRQYRQRGLGSGVIVTSDGYVLTNEHVISGATDVRIMLPDRREFKAKVVGSDPKTDLALLKIDGKNLPSLPLSDSSKMEVGDIVLAIGNPFGVGQSVTMGIVSATARSGVVDPEKYEDFIQTDAAINPGNSGGALVNTKGDLIAINTAIISRSGGNQGIGFAIPVNVASHVMSHIQKSGRVVRGWLGVSIQPVDAATAKAFGLKEPAGALISGVTPGSPAEKAGLERGDIILEFNGQRLPDASELRMKVGMADPDSSATLKVLRNRAERMFTVKLGELREQEQRAQKETDIQTAMNGIQVSELNPRVLRELGLPATTNGVLVDDVEEGTPSADAGLRRNDVILEVNRQRITSVDTFRAALRNRSREPVVLFVNRAGHTLYVVIEAQ